MPESDHNLEFGEFLVDTSERLLFRNGKEVSLTPKVFDTLLVLVQNAGHILSKDEVMKEVWGETIVEEANLTRNISVLRKALGEAPDENQYIETIPWRGYRFVAEVQRVNAGDGASASAQPAGSHIGREVELGDPSQLHPALRYRSLLIACVVVGTVLIAGGALFRLYLSTNQVTPEVRSIAVLPLEDMSADRSQTHLADGMTESLINKLAQIRALRVISRSSVMKYKGSGKSTAEISRELGVDAVVTGAIHRTGNNVRVTVQLIHGNTDSHLWAADLERDGRDILKLESDIARELAAGIRVQLTTDESTRLTSARAVDPGAHEAYLLGQHHLGKNNPDDYQRAFEHFQRATQIDPKYAEAHAGMSNALLQLGIFSARPLNEIAPSARSAALKAIEIDDELADAHISLAILMYSFDWDWTGAEREFRRALELDPGSLAAHRQYGRLLMCLGRHDEAVSEGLTALLLDPASSEAYTDVGRFLYRAQRNEEALPYLQRAIEMEPRSVDANVRLGDVLIELGRGQEAIELFERARDVTGDTRFISFGVARVYAATGRQSEARKLLGDVNTVSFNAAAILALLDDKDGAFRILDHAVQQRSTLLVTLREDPHFKNLHSDPRWQALLTRMNFPA